MFTGIVEGIGKIYDIQKRSLGAKVSLLPPFHAKEVKIGDSLSVDGVCLTVTEIDDKIIKMDILTHNLFLQIYKILFPFCIMQERGI